MDCANQGDGSKDGRPLHKAGLESPNQAMGRTPSEPPDLRPTPGPLQGSPWHVGGSSQGPFGWPRTDRAPQPSNRYHQVRILTGHRRCREQPTRDGPRKAPRLLNQPPSLLGTLGPSQPKPLPWNPISLGVGEGCGIAGGLSESY